MLRYLSFAHSNSPKCEYVSPYPETWGTINIAASTRTKSAIRLSDFDFNIPAPANAKTKTSAYPVTIPYELMKWWSTRYGTVIAAIEHTTIDGIRCLTTSSRSGARITLIAT